MLKKVVFLLFMAMVVMPPLSHGSWNSWLWGSDFLSKTVRIVVFWDQPASNNSDPVTQYNIYRGPSKVGAVSGLSFQWIGNVNISKYRVLPTSLSVQAVDKDGKSPLSTIKVYLDVRTNKLVTVQ